MSPRSHVDVPPALRRRATQVWGDRGRQWLDDLPDHVAACAAAWSLDVGAVFDLSYHWVAAARTVDGTDVVLKLGVPGEPHLVREASVLGRWGGAGAARLVGTDLARGALLLERARPGTMAAELVPSDDDAASRALGRVARALHRADHAGLGLRDIATEAASLEEHAGRHGAHDPLPDGIVLQARDLLLELTRTRSRAVLLHGDLHHHNVLRDTGPGHTGTGGWMAIDPHGWVGDPGFEIGPMLYNPLGTDPAVLVGLLPGRLDVLADELDQPRDRLRAWGFVMAVLSQVWSCQDGGSPEAGPGAVADALRPR